MGGDTGDAPARTDLDGAERTVQTWRACGLDPTDSPAEALYDGVQRLRAALAERDAENARLRAVARDGEFDGTRAEASAWAESPDGQATFTELLRGGGRG